VDNNNGQIEGNRNSMVNWCGQNPKGEEVSVSLVYALGLWTDQTALCKVNIRNTQFLQLMDEHVLSHSNIFRVEERNTS
jgi:hypothetical protein